MSAKNNRRTDVKIDVRDHGTESRRFMLRAGVAFCATTSIVSSRVVGANEKLRVGVIGTGVRGKYLIANIPEADLRWKHST